MTAIQDERYVRLTTFTRDGRAKHTPVWIAPFRGDSMGTTTDADSWKVRRLGNTPKVELSPSDGRGNVAADDVPLTGSARLVSTGDREYAELEAALIAKYGVQYRLFRMIRRLRRKTGRGIVITLDRTDRQNAPTGIH